MPPRRRPGSLYVVSSRLTTRFGAQAVFRGAVAIRIAGFVLLVLPFMIALPARSVIAVLGFLLIMLAWPALSVSGTALTVRLSRVGEGTAIGLLNATGALATVVGTCLAGPLEEKFGSISAPVLALIGLALAEMLMRGAHNRPPRHSSTSATPAEHSA